MALTKKSWQDHLTSSFGQIDEGIRSRTGNDGLITGGVYEAAGSVTAVEHGDFAASHYDANQNLMVNVADGEIQAQLGTVKLVEGGTINAIPLNSVASSKGTVTITTPASAGTLASTLNGLMRYVTQVSPNLEGTGTVTTCLVDSAGGTVAALAAQNESVITTYGTTVPITTDMSWVATADGTQSASVDVVLDIHYER